MKKPETGLSGVTQGKTTKRKPGVASRWRELTDEACIRVTQKIRTSRIYIHRKRERERDNQKDLYKVIGMLPSRIAIKRLTVRI